MLTQNMDRFVTPIGLLLKDSPLPVADFEHPFSFHSIAVANRIGILWKYSIWSNGTVAVQKFERDLINLD